jgi:hypothetical protein
MTAWGVVAYFLEAGREVYELFGPFDRYFAELVCVDMAAGLPRGGEWVHVTRSRIVPWVAG